jgi:hypothetical protein
MKFMGDTEYLTVSPHLFSTGGNMETKLKQRISLREYLRQLTEEILMKEKNYNEELKIDPKQYIRNEYKIISE